MTTLLRVQANRRNALQSTGPRTVRGKLASSRNHVRHGINSWKPVLLPYESRMAWEKFARAVFDDLQPSGPVEMTWAGRAALLMWRLRRAGEARKILADQQWREAEALAPQSAWWKHRNEKDKSFPSSIEGTRKLLAQSRRERKLLGRVAALPNSPAFTPVLPAAPEATGVKVETGVNAGLSDQPVDSITAADLISWASRHLGIEDQLTAAWNANNTYPGIGPLTAESDPEIHEWTLGMVRAGLAEVAAWEKLTLEELLESLVPAMKKAYNQTRAGERRAQREMRQFRLCSAARSAETSRKIDRYERGLEGSLALALSQLRVFQSQRGVKTSPNGFPVAPNVVQMGFVSLKTPEKQG